MNWHNNKCGRSSQRNCRERKKRKKFSSQQLKVFLFGYLNWFKIQSRRPEAIKGQKSILKECTIASCCYFGGSVVVVVVVIVVAVHVTVIIAAVVVVFVSLWSKSNWHQRITDHLQSFLVSSAIDIKTKLVK